MKKFAIATAALAFTGTAHAADMPLKAPPLPIVTAYDWSGFYGDFDIGGGRSRLHWTYANPDPLTAMPFSGSTTDPVAGGHVGFQQEFFSWLVLGVEGGVAINMNNSYSTSTSNGTTAGVCTGGAGVACQMHISMPIDTVGGKLGVAWNDWLFYGVGGAAWSEVQSQVVLLTGALFDTAAASRRGTYAGGGFDYVFFKGTLVDMIAGVEYEHVDLKSGLLTVAPDGFLATGPNARTISAKEDIVLAKLTLKWNPWTQPHP